ncbi:MBL fold metallo-hydrolase [Cryobacterium gelidum]|uniref:MBL fold metallo-hydrolase n=1 Tax=Cryobacterium gelidum TaxID=1259164 RepID=UPI0018E0744D|nr:MBL fold metallo-hydrolase [Cryobacterium gelidum]
MLRQSMVINYEAPFLYLMFGEARAILLDTGATSDPAFFPLRQLIDRLFNEWLAQHPHDDYELMVAHSHSHGDHIAADGQFADRPRTVLVGHSPSDVAEFFGLIDWPAGEAHFELGERRLAILAIPGHEASSIAIWDPTTELLFTGDTVYPGRLYVNDIAAFQNSVDRLLAFSKLHPVSRILGAHIEMSNREGRDYARGVAYHPHEAPLPMTVDQLRAVAAATRTVAARPGAHRFNDFAIFNGPCKSEMTRQNLRARIRRLWPF